jgi:hypothetical protein
MRLLYRILHSLLVLALTAFLVSSVYYAFFLLRLEQRPAIFNGNDDDVKSRRPSPQDIVSSNMNLMRLTKLMSVQAASMNTLWNYLDDHNEDHCISVCEASWKACQLRNCHGLPDTRKQEL